MKLEASVEKRGLASVRSAALAGFWRASWQPS
jgi:hypothetical protein